MRLHRHTSLALILTLWLYAAALPAAWAKAIPSGMVSAMSGRLWLQRANSPKTTPLQLRQQLYTGDIVGTGERSGATILFPDGAQARLDAKAKIQITGTPFKKGRTSLFRVIAGQVWGHLRPGNAIETRTAALGVLGTQILLNVAGDGATTLTVTDGRVDFSNDFGRVEVGQNQRSTARFGAPPSKPISIQNGGVIVEWWFDLDRAMIPREKFFVTPDRQAALAQLPRLAAAALAAEAAQEPKPALALVKQHYGDALFDSGRHEEARAQYEAAARLAPGQAGLKIRLGYALLETGHLEEADSAMRAALPDPSHAEARLISQGDSEDAEDGTDAGSSQAAALVALANLNLERGQPELAHEMATRAVRAAQGPLSRAQVVAADTADGASTWASSWGEAHLALGLSLLRQAGRSEQAIPELRLVLQSEPSSLHYQARAWLSLALLARNDTAAALEQARQAVQLQPRSGLAHGNLALVAFYTGEAGEAEREAKLALELNPKSVAARVALGQALLAQGKVDSASRYAAQAVALDGGLPQARYLLGISEASRRDYKHALRELGQAVVLAPSDARARAALARAYTAVGSTAQAEALLREALPPRRQAPSVARADVAGGGVPDEVVRQEAAPDTILAALGDVLYEKGEYSDSVTQYQKATRQNGQSALYQAGLARSLIVSNRLADAIKAAQAAVTLAPSVGQYHALLGVAYQFSQMPTQAKREFDDALIRDPQNALALAQLAFRYEGSDQRPAAIGFSQGFLLDPSIARQLLRGGVNAEVTPSLGDRGSGGIALAHRGVADQGKVNSFGFLSRSDSPGFRPNEGRRRLDISEHVTILPDSKTSLYFSGRAQRDTGGLPGSLLTPDSTDRSQFGYGQLQVAARRRLSSSSHLWLGLFGNASRNTTQDPGQDSFFDPTTGLHVPSQRFTSRALVPEIRYDRDLNRDPARTSRLSLGAAFTGTRFRSLRTLDSPLQPQMGIAMRSAADTGTGLFSERDRGLLLYSQFSQQIGTRFSASAQLRLQQLSRSSSWEVAMPSGPGGPIGASQNSSRSYVLPNLLLSYQASPKDTLRLQLTDRLTDITSSTLAPSETLLTTERSALPTGVAERTRLSQIELQRRTSDRSFLKIFGFHTQASNVQLGYSDLLGFGNGLPAPQAPGLTIDRWRGTGAGAVYEQQVGPRLFVSTGATVRSTNAQSLGLQTGYSGQQAPYEPKYLARLNLNYIDGKGNKAGIAVRRVGSFFQDTPLALDRPSFGAATYVDLLLAKERTAGAEFYLSVTNIFNRQQLLFNGFPGGQRRINFGVTRRF